LFIKNSTNYRENPNQPNTKVTYKLMEFILGLDSIPLLKSESVVPGGSQYILIDSIEIEQSIIDDQT